MYFPLTALQFPLLNAASTHASFYKNASNKFFFNAAPRRSLRISMDFFERKSFIHIFLILSRFLGGVAGNLAP